MSNITFQNGSYNAYLIESVTSKIFIVLISCFGVIANGIVCYIVYSSKRIRQPLNCLLANLALSDLIHSFMIGIKYTFPLLIRSLSLTSNSISPGLINTICNFVMFVIVIAMSNSMWSLAVISMERCRAILKPLRFSDSKRRMTVIFIFIWLTSLIYSILLVVSREYDNSGFIDCSGTLTTRGNLSNAILTTAYTSFAIIIPCVIMIICYSIIVIKLRDKPLPMDDSQYKAKIQKSEQKKVTCIASLMVITVLTSIVGGPFFMLYNFLLFQKAYDHHFLQRTSEVFWTIFHLFSVFTLIPNVLNPLLYNYASSTFRKEMKKTFQMLGFRIRRQVSFLRNKRTDPVNEV